MKKQSCAATTLVSIVLCLARTLSLVGCGDSSAGAGYRKNESLETSQEVLLRIAGGIETWPEMDNVVAKLEETPTAP